MEIKKRLECLKSIPEGVFFNYRDRNKRHKTKALFISLTYSREHRINIAWEKVGSDFNRWIFGLKRKYGNIQLIRAWEVQSDGCPHVHWLLFFEEKEFVTFFYNKKWRIEEKDELSKNWCWGFVDILALNSIKAGIGYVVKYLTKIHRSLVHKTDSKGVLTLALMWIFRKRAFSVSDNFRIIQISSYQFQSKNVGQVDLEGRSIYKWVLVGFWGGSFKTWFRTLSHKEFIKIRLSESFTNNIKN